MILRPDSYECVRNGRKENTVIHKEERDILAFQEGDGKLNPEQEDFLCFEVKNINPYTARLICKMQASRGQ
jgi:hypothetical protein